MQLAIHAPIERLGLLWHIRFSHSVKLFTRGETSASQAGLSSAKPASKQETQFNFNVGKQRYLQRGYIAIQRPLAARSPRASR